MITGKLFFREAIKDETGPLGFLVGLPITQVNEKRTKDGH
jgi:hypothetical protein